MARGNTLDNRGVLNGHVPTAYAITSNRAAAGISSHTGSRPESASKMRPGMSPTNNDKTIKINNKQKDFKNFVLSSDKHVKKPITNNIVVVN